MTLSLAAPYTVAEVDVWEEMQGRPDKRLLLTTFTATTTLIDFLIPHSPSDGRLQRLANMSSSRNVEDTYEAQNDQRLDELHSKLRTLRGVSTNTLSPGLSCITMTAFRRSQQIYTTM